MANNFSVFFVGQILKLAKELFLQCTTPEAVLRVKHTHLQGPDIPMSKKYFTEQKHGSLAELLQQELIEKDPQESVFMQVLHYFSKKI